MKNEECVPVLRALSDHSRMRLVTLLAKGGRTVEDLAHYAGLQDYNASRHLRVLREAGLVITERKGRHICYRIPETLIVDKGEALQLDLGCCCFRLDPCL